MQRRHLDIPGPGVHIRPSLQQRRRAAHVAPLRRDMQGSAAIVIPGLHLGGKLQEHAHAALLPLQRSADERAVPRRVPLADVCPELMQCGEGRSVPRHSCRYAWSVLPLVLSDGIHVSPRQREKPQVSAVPPLRSRANDAVLAQVVAVLQSAL